MEMRGFRETGEESKAKHILWDANSLDALHQHISHVRIREAYPEYLSMLLNQLLPVISFNIITKASMSVVWFLFLCCEVTCWVQRATKALHQLMPHEGEKRSESYMHALLRGGSQETHAWNIKLNKQTKQIRWYMPCDGELVLWLCWCCISYNNQDQSSLHFIRKNRIDDSCIDHSGYTGAERANAWWDERE